MDEPDMNDTPDTPDTPQDDATGPAFEPTPAADLTPAQAPAKAKAPRKSRAKVPAAADGAAAPGTALSLIVGTVAEIDRTAAALDALEAKHAGVVYDVKTPKGLQDARAARLEIRMPRYAVQNLVEAEVSQLEQAKRQVKAHAEPVLTRLEALEKPVDTQIKNREREVEEEKAERERVAREAAVRVQRAMDEIRAHVAAAVLEGAEQIAARIDALDAMDISLELFEGRAGEAEMARSITRDTLETMLERAEALEAQQVQSRKEAEQLAADRKRLAEERAALARDQAEWAARQAPPPVAAPAPQPEPQPDPAPLPEPDSLELKVKQTMDVMNYAQSQTRRTPEAVYASRELQMERMEASKNHLFECCEEIMAAWHPMTQAEADLLTPAMQDAIQGLHGLMDGITLVYEK